MKEYKNKCWLDPEWSTATRKNMSDAWTDERKETFAEVVRQRYKDNPAFAKAVSDQHKGKPKSDEQKQKMREAKLGVRKSDDHKANMRKAHLKRYAILAILKDTGLTHKQAMANLKEHRDTYYKEYDQTGSINIQS